MKYLLDTHTFLWSVFSSKKLSYGVKDAITDENNTVYLSIVSFWEISIKYHLNKIHMGKTMPEDLPEIARKSGFEIFPLNIDEVSSSYKLPKISHKDPFDRLLIWQCIKNSLIIITRDGTFKEYSKFGLQIFW